MEKKIKEVEKTINPDYQSAQSKAWEILKDYSHPTLPIDLGQIISSVPNLDTITYSRLAELCGCSVPEVAEIADSDDGTLWYRNTQDDYLIAYNDTIPNEGQKRFTIAHELGHFFLKHDEVCSQPLSIVTKRLGFVSDDEYATDEKEANYFAKRLLAPIPLIVDISRIIGAIDIFTMATIFNISQTAAEYVIDNMNNLQKHGFYPIDYELSSLYRGAVSETAKPYM